MQIESVAACRARCRAADARHVESVIARQFAHCRELDWLMTHRAFTTKRRKRVLITPEQLMQARCPPYPKSHELCQQIDEDILDVNGTCVDPRSIRTNDLTELHEAFPPALRVSATPTNLVVREDHLAEAVDNSIHGVITLQPCSEVLGFFPELAVPVGQHEHPVGFDVPVAEYALQDMDIRTRCHGHAFHLHDQHDGIHST
mmetsp:Transcript_17767/g.47514  ORF Transcript_17767/g.47514 Transcript_17767/m.47514 type:complete len:202 (+) Transcript_17767:525-1130(+)